MRVLPARTVAQAPPNIAFVKYWGKRDLVLNLPAADSFSVCLDRFHAVVTAERLAAGDDLVSWNATPVGPPHHGRFTRLADRVRELAGTSFPVRVAVQTALPPRLGLAGSAAAMAAAALALSRLHGLDLAEPELSALARLGSGSACRSVPGGFVHWQAGRQADGRDSFGRTVAGPDHWPDLALLLVVTATGPKAVSSTEGMLRSASSSPFYAAWVEQCAALVPVAVAAVRARDWRGLMDVSELSARSMHAVALSASPPILYASGSTLSVIDLVHELRAAGTPVFFTLDAGPNPVVVTLAAYARAVEAALAARVPEARVHCCRPGAGARLVA
jgi:diphosphomevalonate decarboxylase